MPVRKVDPNPIAGLSVSKVALGGAIGWGGGAVELEEAMPGKGLKPVSRAQTLGHGEHQWGLALHLCLS